MTDVPASNRIPEPAHGHTEPTPHHPINYVRIFITLVVLTIVTVGVAFLGIKQEWQKVLLALAIAAVSLEIGDGEIFGCLAPNGSGKTTLFRVLSTLIVPQEGSVTYRFGNEGAGLDLRAARDAVRRQIGVVFQSPSLDKQLTAE